MTEFTDGMVRALKKLNTNGSLLRTLVYTVGHFLIAVACVIIITGATVTQAASDAAIEPLLNSVWFFVLDRFWATNIANKKHIVNDQQSVRVVPEIDVDNVDIENNEPRLDI